MKTPQEKLLELVDRVRQLEKILNERPKINLDMFDPDMIGKLMMWATQYDKWTFNAEKIITSGDET